MICASLNLHFFTSVSFDETDSHSKRGIRKGAPQRRPLGGLRLAGLLLRSGQRLRSKTGFPPDPHRDCYGSHASRSSTKGPVASLPYGFSREAVVSDLSREQVRCRNRAPYQHDGGGRFRPHFGRRHHRHGPGSLQPARTVRAGRATGGGGTGLAQSSAWRDFGRSDPVTLKHAGINPPSTIALGADPENAVRSRDLWMSLRAHVGTDWFLPV